MTLRLKDPSRQANEGPFCVIYVLLFLLMKTNLLRIEQVLNRKRNEPRFRETEFTSLYVHLLGQLGRQRNHEPLFVRRNGRVAHTMVLPSVENSIYHF